MSAEGERAKGLLKLANYARVAEVLGVSRASVARWAKGQQVTPWQLQRLQELLGRDETAPPEWARRLRVELLEAIRSAGMTDQERAALRAIDATARPTSEADDDPPVEGEPGPAHRPRHTPRHGR